jgi:hypothetical protein
MPDIAGLVDGIVHARRVEPREVSVRNRRCNHSVDSGDDDSIERKIGHMLENRTCLKMDQASDELVQLAM